MRFNQWWNKTGFDLCTQPTVMDEGLKLQAIAAACFNAGRAAAQAESSNYTADKEVEPTEVTFANGRRVLIAKNSAEGAEAQPFLIVLMADNASMSAN